MRTAVIFAGLAAAADAFTAPGAMRVPVAASRALGMVKSVRASPAVSSRSLNMKTTTYLASLSKKSAELNPAPGTVASVFAQGGKLAAATPSLTSFVVLNVIMTRLFKGMGLTSVPPPLAGMFLMFFALLALPEKTSGKVVDFFKPAVDLITRFLPMFFVPALIALPLSASTIAGADAARALACILVGLVTCYISTAFVTVGLQKISPPPSTTLSSAGGALPGFSQFLETMFGAFVVITGLAASKAPAVAPIFMLVTTIFSFVVGSRLPRLLPPALGTVWHPLMSTFVVSTMCFSAYAAAAGTTLNAVLKAYLVPGGGPLTAAGNAIMYWLGPAIWSFSFGLFARRQILFANLVPIVGGTVWAAVSGIFMMASLNRIIAPSMALKLAVLPRATAALAVVQAGMIGASASLVTAVCVLTGMLGANFGKVILNAVGIKSPCARGVATGGAAFSLGAAALAKDDPDAFPFGALAMALMSTWATLLYAVPQVATSAVSLSGINSALVAKAAPVKKVAPKVVFKAAPAKKVAPKPVAKPAPKPVAKPAPKPVAKAPPAPAKKAATKPAAKKDDKKGGLFGFGKKEEPKKGLFGFGK